VDAWRSYQLELTTANLEHPFSRYAQFQSFLWNIISKASQLNVNVE